MKIVTSRRSCFEEDPIFSKATSKNVRKPITGSTERKRERGSEGAGNESCKNAGWVASSDCTYAFVLCLSYLSYWQPG